MNLLASIAESPFFAECRFDIYRGTESRILVPETTEKDAPESAANATQRMNACPETALTQPATGHAAQSDEYKVRVICVKCGGIRCGGILRRMQ